MNYPDGARIASRDERKGADHFVRSKHRHWKESRHSSNRSGTRKKKKKRIGVFGPSLSVVYHLCDELLATVGGPAQTPTTRMLKRLLTVQ